MFSHSCGDLFFWPMGYLDMYWLIQSLWAIFLVIFCCWFLAYFYIVHNIFSMISVLLIFVEISLWPSVYLKFISYGKHVFGFLNLVWYFFALVEIIIAFAFSFCLKNLTFFSISLTGMLHFFFNFCLVMSLFCLNFWRIFQWV